MFPPVFETLTGDSDVASIVARRIYRHDRAPQDTTRPYVTWYLLNGTPENQLSDLPIIDRLTIQVDCWHPEDAGVVDLATAVRDAIEPNAYMTSVPIDTRETETKLYRIGLQFDWLLER